ncbi:carboxylic acid transporter [Suillus hirtellus]|nr:carboxylic acid transporter [Suillus hirtellus]
MPSRFIRELIPRRETRTSLGGVVAALKSLTWVQWAQFWSGSVWLAWACDAIDYVAVSLTVSRLSTQFGKSTSAITTALTLTLLLRSVGAVIFGMISDRYGRKWPLVVNLLICCVIELGTGFVDTFSQFLVLRALFGIAMGGIWGLSSSSALENLPVELRGLASGILQEGYIVGYIFAAVVNLTLVAQYGWRSLFWTGAGITFFAAVVRALVPESPFFLQVKEQEKEKGTDTSQSFLRKTKEMLKHHWLLCIYGVLLMHAHNMYEHALDNDLFPTYLQITKGFSAHDATVATIISNCVRSYSGGAMGGWGSQYIGRRLTIIKRDLFFLAVFIPLWVLPSSFSALSAGGFCVQVGVQGAWGVIPIQLAEMSPPAFRATFPGVVYQLGNMVAAASAQIEATGGDNLKTTIMENGVLTVVPDYATATIFIGSVAIFVIVIALIVPE